MRRHGQISSSLVLTASLLVGMLCLHGCAVLPVTGGEQAGVFQVFEPGAKMKDTGVGFAGYWFRDQQPGVFLHLQTSFSGAVSGIGVGNLPVAGEADPVTSQEVHGVSIAVGPTWRVNDQLSVYGGLGVGSISVWEERFDVDLEVSPTGYYHYDRGTESGLHATIGSLIHLGDDWILDVGYGSYGESIHVGLGYSY